MKVLLVKPYNISDHIQPSLGLGYLATAIRDKHSVRILDCIKEGVNAKKFGAFISKYKPDVVGLSALLTTTMPAMKDTIDALTEAGLRDSVKVIIGGAPVTNDFAKEIGADGFAPDAASASELVGTFILK